MRTIAQLLSLAVGAASLSGCVNLEVDRRETAAQVDAPPTVDMPTYFLSKTSLVIVGTFTLNDCDGVAATATLPPGRHLDIDAPPIDLTETFTIAAASQADREQEYRIPLDKTRSWAKQLNLTIARNPDKTLVSVNGTLADQAGPTLLAAAQTAIAVAGAVALPPAAPLITTVTTKAVQAETRGRVADHSFIDSRGSTKLHPVTRHIKVTNRSEDPARIFVSRNFCTADVHAVLAAIGTQQKTISDATAAAAKKKKADGAASGTGTGAAAAPSDPVILKAQATIARLRVENNLTRTVRLVWTPSRDELVAAARASSGTPGSPDRLILYKSFDLFQLVVASHWFTQTGADAAVREAGCVTEDRTACGGITGAGTPGSIYPAKPSKTVARLVAPLTVEVALKGWTVGRAHGEQSLAGQLPADAPPKTYDGIVYRDPALATVRMCQGDCGGELTGAMAAGSITSTAMPNDRLTLTDPDNALIETTADLATLTVPIAQFGRLDEISMRSKLFETSVATLMQNTDGSIASVGTQSSNAAAAGFAAATAAANAQTSSLAARNTATGAVNTALGTKAQYVDTVNKAIADCLAQQATLTAQGAQPVGQCQ